MRTKSGVDAEGKADAQSPKPKAKTTTETVRELSRKYGRIENLMRYVNEDTLKEAHQKQDGRKATGVDRVTKDKYGENLDENLQDLVQSTTRSRFAEWR